jgi:hypothetical protein
VPPTQTRARTHAQGVLWEQEELLEVARASVDAAGDRERRAAQRAAAGGGDGGDDKGEMLRC